MAEQRDSMLSRLARGQGSATDLLKRFLRPTPSPVFSMPASLYNLTTNNHALHRELYALEVDSPKTH